MHGVKEIIQKAESLPVEKRARVVESLLRSLNPPDANIDRQWAIVAQQRLAEIHSGVVQPISGEAVRAKIQRRFGK